VIEGIIFLIAKLASIIIFISGLAGFILTFAIDRIRGRLTEFDWLQIGGLVIFLILFLTGGFMLWQLRKTVKG